MVGHQYLLTLLLSVIFIILGSCLVVNYKLPSFKVLHAQSSPVFYYYCSTPFYHKYAPTLYHVTVGSLSFTALFKLLFVVIFLFHIFLFHCNDIHSYRDMLHCRIKIFSEDYRVEIVYQGPTQD